MKLTLIIPSYGGGANIERTIQSCRKVADETVIISTALFDSDLAHFKTIADKVVELPWNFTFLHGHGSLHNQGTATAKNDWLLLLGVAETFAAPYGPVGDVLGNAGKDLVFRCNHDNDHHTWKRIWNRTGGTQWSGVIHEEIAFGQDGGILFRMQDTEKLPDPDAFRQEVRKYVKTCSYHFLYERLARNPECLGATDAGWLKFVQGSVEAREKFLTEHADLLDAAVNDKKDAFLCAVEKRMAASKAAEGVNFAPQGEAESLRQTGVNLARGGYEHLIEKP